MQVSSGPNNFPPRAPNAEQVHLYQRYRQEVLQAENQGDKVQLQGDKVEVTAPIQLSACTRVLPGTTIHQEAKAGDKILLEQSSGGIFPRRTWVTIEQSRQGGLLRPQQDLLTTTSAKDKEGVAFQHPIHKSRCVPGQVVATTVSDLNSGLILTDKTEVAVGRSGEVGLGGLEGWQVASTPAFFGGPKEGLKPTI